MKCPVCKKTIFNQELPCPYCGFADLYREFVNRQDAQDWETRVVIPYREKWEKGILTSDAWLKRIYECSAFHAEIEKEKATRLTLDADSDLNIDNPERILSLFVKEYNGDIDEILARQLSKFCNIQKIFFSYEYRGKINCESLNYIIRSCPNLIKLDFNGAIDYEILARIDLSKIEDLHITLRNSFSPVLFCAPALKSLKVTGSFMGVKKRETKKIKRMQYDLSGMPALEDITIRYCSDFDYCSFSSLTKLQALRIYDECPIDLLWLSNAYKLETLSVSGKVSSLAGIECQTTLQRLELRHNNISDISKLKSLSELKYLDLGFNQVANIEVIGQLQYLEYIDLTNNELIDESYLRSFRISTAIFTKVDKELHAIRQMFTGKVLGTFPGDVCYLMKVWETKDLNTESPYMQNRILKWREKDYKERTKEIVQMVFQRKYYELCKGHCVSVSIKTVEKQHKQTYVSIALQHYPFLRLTSDIQVDMSGS